MSCNPSAAKYAPGQPLSTDLTQALGLVEGTPPPWVDRMRRYGWPPGYLIGMLDQKTLDVVDDASDQSDAENDQQKKVQKEDPEDPEDPETETKSNEQLLTFPMYMWAPDHPAANAMFGHLYRPPETASGQRTIDTSVMQRTIGRLLGIKKTTTETTETNGTTTDAAIDTTTANEAEAPPSAPMLLAPWPAPVV